jgi:LacI family transcriptional regulator
MMLRGRAAVIYDVARLTGVPHQMVSRVVDDRPGVSAGTRRRVLAAMRHLGLRGNATARRLSDVRSRTIGIVALETTLYGPASTLVGIEKAASERGYGASVSTVDRADRGGVLQALGALADQSVAGVVVIAPRGSTVRALQSLPGTMPAVAVESEADGRIPVVSVDQRAGARMAVEHLIGLGHRRIWHVAGPPDWLEARARIEGWRAALEHAGLPAAGMLTGDWTARSGYAAGLELAAEAVTAVFAGNDHMALGMLRALHEKGLRVPEDVSVVGFDDIPEARYLRPPLTTIRRDFDEVGRRCVTTLLALIEGARKRARPAPQPAPPVRPELVVRRSTAVCQAP